MPSIEKRHISFDKLKRNNQVKMVVGTHKRHADFFTNHIQSAIRYYLNGIRLSVVQKVDEQDGNSFF